MAETINEVRVNMAPDGFYPRAFRWAGRDVRVLSVDALRTCGPERRFTVRTVEGVYELTQDLRARVWRMRRSPTWFSRALAQVSQEPRYGLPSGSRRSSRNASLRGIKRS
jgi:hypothetical protein